MLKQSLNLDVLFSHFCSEKMPHMLGFLMHVIMLRVCINVLLNMKTVVTI